MSATPIATVEAGAEVAEAIVNATIVADGGAPVAGVPEVASGAVSPVAGSPEGSGVGRENPGAVYPLVAVIGPGPVAGGPDVAVAGSDGLGVDGDGGGRYSNRDKDTGVSRCGSHEECACEDCYAEDSAKTTGEVHSVPLPVALRLALICKGFADGWRRFLSASLCGSGTQYIRHKCGGFVARK